MSKQVRRTKPLHAWCCACLLIGTLPCFVKCEEVETLRYLRPSGNDFRLETTIKFANRSDGRSITSVTQRGKTTLTVASNFGDKDELRHAQVTLASDDHQSVASARQENGKATVTRADGKTAVLDCPRGVIVTSAPDWTDAIMLMRRYDTQRGGEQKFAGLWIHPVREPLQLTFGVLPLGKDEVTVDGKRHRLDRFQITLRNNSRYIAWRDDQRQLIRLVAGAKAQPAIVLAGWERVTVGLTQQR